MLLPPSSAAEGGGLISNKPPKNKEIAANAYTAGVGDEPQGWFGTGVGWGKAKAATPPGWGGADFGERGPHSIPGCGGGTRWQPLEGTGTSAHSYVHDQKTQKTSKKTPTTK